VLRRRLESSGAVAGASRDEAELEELAEAYVRLDERMTKLIAISDKYQSALLETTERLRRALAELAARGLEPAPQAVSVASRAGLAPPAAAREQRDPLMERLKVAASSGEAPRPSDVAAFVKRYQRLDARLNKIVTISDRYQEQLREVTRRLDSMARADPLTNLSNRRDMVECLDREVERFGRYGKDFSILLFDIDDFKRVNDDYGHDAGDRVLKSLALVFLENLRRSDACARWGGEEFLILCPETGIEQARVVGEKCVRATAAMEVETKAGAIRITLSGGVAAMRSGLDRDSLIIQADEKLYVAKASGKDRLLG
jgi:diguanylate cyclase